MTTRPTNFNHRSAEVVEQKHLADTVTATLPADQRTEFSLNGRLILDLLKSR